jgi:glucose-6-phosphate 1-dehydrogenase
MNQFLFILFGASSDLAKRKLIPALFQLFVAGRFNNCFILGIAHTDQDLDLLLENARPFIETFILEKWVQFKQIWQYQKASVTHIEDLNHLKIVIESLEKMHHLSGDRIIYSAIAASLFEIMVKNIFATNIAQKTIMGSKIQHKIIFEKPFGWDHCSAHIINEAIQERFDESQIYRIDHYLTKEIVSNIALIRFTNLFFQPLWNNQYIDQVHIVLNETADVEGRGAYYDQFGALKDVVQNHMLQLMALIAMDSPEKLTGNYIATQRIKILSAVEFVDGMLGQYEGYRKESLVKSGSTTETFAALLFKINHPEWQGVPFFMRTGKALDKQEVAVHIKFKPVKCLLMKNCPTNSNWLTISLSPEARFYLELNVKKAGYQDQVVSTVMEIPSTHEEGNIFGVHSYQAYENLIIDVIRQEQASAVRFDEIECSWKIIDSIKEKNLPLYTYLKKSDGPLEMKQYAQKWNMSFKNYKTKV